MASVGQIQAAAQKLLDFSSADFDLVALEQIMALSQNPRVAKDQVSQTSEVSLAFRARIPHGRSAALFMDGESQGCLCRKRLRKMR